MHPDHSLLEKQWNYLYVTIHFVTVRWYNNSVCNGIERILPNTRQGIFLRKTIKADKNLFRYIKK